MIQVPTKPIWKSKLFWLGVVQISGGILELVATEVLLTDGGGWAAVASGAVTILLRYITKQPVTVSGKMYKSIEEGPLR